MIKKYQYIKWGVWVCFILAIGLLLWLQIDNASRRSEIHKLAWCYVWALVGMGTRGYLKLKENDIRKNMDSSEDKDFHIRYVAYLITLIFFGLFTFLILNKEKSMQDPILYLLSFTTFFLMGFYVFLLENKLGK